MSFVDYDASSVVSVGSRMSNNVVVSTSHPTYRQIADAVSEEVAALARKDAVRRTRAAPAVLPFGLTSEVGDELSADYPEFRLVVYEMDVVGHAYYEASAYLANEWMLLQAAKVATTVTHLGGRILTSILSSDVEVHLEMDPSNAVAVHNRHRDNRYASRIMSDYARLSEEYGKVPYGRFYAYSRKETLRACTSADCRVSADAYCADGSVYPISYQQFCCAMLQGKSSVGYFFFPYHPSMLMANEGEIPGTGVWYKKDYNAGELRLKYPSGVCGAEVWPLAAWASWCCETAWTVGAGSKAHHYQLQLMKNRGPFMFAQVVLTSTLAKGVVHRHALELPQAESQYVISGWSLKTLASDPNVASAWKRVVFMAPVKIVDAVVAFGMQLDNAVFNRYHIRRQLTLYDRVTVEGTSVRKGFNPTDEELEILTTYIHAYLFNERYEAHKLSKEMMQRLNAVTGFSGSPDYKRVKAVALWSMLRVWDYTGGAIADGLGTFFDWIANVFGGKDARLPTFELAPERVVIETLVSSWRRSSPGEYTKALTSVSSPGNSQCRTLKGYSLVTRVAEITKAAQASVTDVVRASVVHTAHVEILDGVTSATELGAGVDVTDELRDALMQDVASINQMDQPSHLRHIMPTEEVVRGVNQTDVMVEDQDLDLDFVNTFNEVYSYFNPGMNEQPLDRDIASIAFDDQDKSLVADYLRMPRLNPDRPRDKVVFRSRVKALGAPKRQETTPELIAALNARTLAAPVVSLPQNDSVLIPQIWENFLNRMCVPDARQKLVMYQEEWAALEESAYRDWMEKSRPDVRAAVARSINEFSEPCLSMNVGDYLAMLKSDVKPPLSDKPMRSRIEPQVIVYHEKLLSSLYSSIFRIMVRRFLSLLKPNVHVNLLKDQVDVRNFIQAWQPFDEKITYLENDFSKYDKSQDEFVFKLEEYIFGELGMNPAFLRRWVEGHKECTLRSFTTGLVLHVRFQRKSGDATTAFGNVVLNINSVAYAYDLGNFAWAVFMGDDSLVAVRDAVLDERAVQVLSEVFNLTAKMYVTDAPYFASWFFVMDTENRHVAGLPDPIKWIEKRSQMVDANNPMWEDKFRSASENSEAYRYKMNTHLLASKIIQRYQVPYEQARRLPAAVYTATKEFEYFRSCHEGQSEFLLY